MLRSSTALSRPFGVWTCVHLQRSSLHFLSFKCTLPPLNKYSSVTDPIEHVRNFHTTISLALGGDLYLLWVFPHSLEDTLVWFLQLKYNNSSSLEAFSIEFVWNYLLLVQEPKMTDHLFEVIGQAHETFKCYIVRFEDIFRTIIDPHNTWCCSLLDEAY